MGIPEQNLAILYIGLPGSFLVGPFLKSRVNLESRVKVPGYQVYLNGILLSSNRITILFFWVFHCRLEKRVTSERNSPKL